MLAPQAPALSSATGHGHLPWACGLLCKTAFLRFSPTVSRSGLLLQDIHTCIHTRRGHEGRDTWDIQGTQDGTHMGHDAHGRQKHTRMQGADLPT